MVLCRMNNNLRELTSRIPDIMAGTWKTISPLPTVASVGHSAPISNDPADRWFSAFVHNAYGKEWLRLTPDLPRESMRQALDSAEIDMINTRE